MHSSELRTALAQRIAAATQLREAPVAVDASASTRAPRSFEVRFGRAEPPQARQAGRAGAPFLLRRGFTVRLCHAAAPKPDQGGHRWDLAIDDADDVRLAIMAYSDSDGARSIQSTIEWLGDEEPAEVGGGAYLVQVQRYALLQQFAIGEVP